MDQNRIRFVTTNYHQLQGLRFVPLGVFLTLFGLVGFLGLFDATDQPSADRAQLLTRIGLVFWLAIGLDVGHA
jgi:hypothetical protein